MNNLKNDTSGFNLKRLGYLYRLSKNFETKLIWHGKKVAVGILKISLKTLKKAVLNLYHILCLREWKIIE
jgi:hypothetical protein